MSPTFFGDAEYQFALDDFALIAELERATDCGIGRLAHRIISGEFAANDINHTLRLALIGGGLDPQRAAELVDTYALPTGLIRCQIIAVEVLGSLFAGDETPENPE